MPRKITPFLLAAALALAGTASAQLTLYYGVTADYLQTGAATVALDTRPVGGAYHFSFITSISSGADAVNDPQQTLKYHDTVNMVFGTTHGMPFITATDPVMAALGGSKDGERFATLGALQTDYPNFTYKLTYTVSGSPQNLTTADGAIPGLPATTPQFTLSGGAWSGGFYQIAQNQALGVVTNAFTAYAAQSANGGDVVSLKLYADNDPENPVLAINRLNFVGAGSPANFFNESVAANTLTPGVAYTLQATFMDAKDDDSVFGNDGPFSAVTTFAQIQVTAVPEPSAYAALAGLAALGCAAWRRRRAQG